MQSAQDSRFLLTLEAGQDDMLAQCLWTAHGKGCTSNLGYAKERAMTLTAPHCKPSAMTIQELSNPPNNPNGSSGVQQDLLPPSPKDSWQHVSHCLTLSLGHLGLAFRFLGFGLRTYRFEVDWNSRLKALAFRDAKSKNVQMFQTLPPKPYIPPFWANGLCSKAGASGHKASSKQANKQASKQVEMDSVCPSKSLARDKLKISQTLNKHPHHP